MSTEASDPGHSVAAGARDASEAEKARRLAAVEPLVRGMCAKRLGSRGADDASQAVLEQVWRAQRQQVFDSEESVRRYAATVARVVQGHDDRRSAWSVPAGDLGEVLWADEGPGPAELAERAEAVAHARERVAALLERLSPRERAVIEAVHFGERSNVEVAEELGITASGVRSASVRAMARLRGEVGAASPNPLAHDRSAVVSPGARAAARADAGVFPQGPASAPVIEAAQRFVLEQGRVPSRSELQRLTGTSGHTAQHVVRALRAQRGERFERTSPLHERADAAARGFVAEHGRLPAPDELQRLAAVSDHTARAVLRAAAATLAGPTSWPASASASASVDAQVAGAPGAGGPRRSPSSDRAEVAARAVLAETGQMPTWRQVAERAEVGRSTAAEVLRALRAQTRHPDPRTDDRRGDPAWAWTGARDGEGDELGAIDPRQDRAASGEDDTTARGPVPEERTAAELAVTGPAVTGPTVTEPAVDEAMAEAPGVAPTAHDSQTEETADVDPPPAVDPVQAVEPVPAAEQARSVEEARAAVVRAAGRVAEQTRRAESATGRGDAASEQRADQLAMWSRADLEPGAHGEHAHAGDDDGRG